MAILRHHHKNDDKILVASTAPSVRVTIAEEFGCDSGSLSTMKMVDALRRIGFDYVFDTNFTADLTIIEEANEFISRVLANVSTNDKYITKRRNDDAIAPLPMFTSCCPGWVNMVEKCYPDLIPHLSSCRSPQGMMGSLIKHYVSKKYSSWNKKQIISVSIMPCVAKKDEAWREQLNIDTAENDFVLTTRELGHLFRLNGIHWDSLKEDPTDSDCLYDSMLGESTGASVIFGATGGVMEAALRTARDTLMPKNKQLTLDNIDFKDVRGLQGVKDATIRLDLAKETANELGLPTPLEVKVAVAHQGGEMRNFIDSGKWKNYHFIEMMACRGGCIGGGGQPKSLDPFVIEKRLQSIYGIDKSLKNRKSHENSEVKALYDDFLHKPNSHVAHRYLHTHYKDRSDEVYG